MCDESLDLELNKYFANPELVEESDEEVDMSVIDQFLSKYDTGKTTPHNKVMVPQTLADDTSASGELYGYIREDTGYHCIIGWRDRPPIPELKAQMIGFIGDHDEYPDLPPQYLKGERTEKGLEFTLVSAEPDGSTSETYLYTDIYTMKQDIFSRNSGLIETDLMDDVLVFIGGCGSVGSLICLQLARSGVRRFVLCDTDCVEIHNVCRHQCSLVDVGRLKVDAVAERILQINPDAEVNRFYQKVQDIPPEKYEHLITDPKKTLFIGTCDNRIGNSVTCDIAKRFNAPFMATFFMTRAWALEVYIYLPERNDICYHCAFKKSVEESEEEEKRNLFYIGQDDLKKADFMPGLDVDLEYGTSLFDKLVLDVINRYNPNYKMRLAHKLTQLTMFAGTDDRSFSNPFWDRHLPEPLSHVSLTFSEDCRRCETCLGKDE